MSFVRSNLRDYICATAPISPAEFCAQVDRLIMRSRPMHLAFLATERKLGRFTKLMKGLS
jgi:hypothetical protein